MTTTFQAGPGEALFIDDYRLDLPDPLAATPVLRKAYSSALGGRRVAHVPIDGVGLPNEAIEWEWTLEYAFDDSFGASIDFFERLRACGGDHTLVDWRQRYAVYTARSGQAEFWLPRPDAFVRAYLGFTSQALWGAIVRVNAGAPLDVAYVGDIDSAVVPGGAVAISTVTERHPRAGARGARFRLGTPCVSGDVVDVRFYPFYFVSVANVESKPYTSSVREDPTIRLTEVA